MAGHKNTVKLTLTDKEAFALRRLLDAPDVRTDALDAAFRGCRTPRGRADKAAAERAWQKLLQAVGEVE